MANPAMINTTGTNVLVELAEEFRKLNWANSNPDELAQKVLDHSLIQGSIMEFTNPDDGRLAYRISDGVTPVDLVTDFCERHYRQPPDTSTRDLPTSYPMTPGVVATRSNLRARGMSLKSSGTTGGVEMIRMSTGSHGETRDPVAPRPGEELRGESTQQPEANQPPTFDTEQRHHDGNGVTDSGERQTSGTLEALPQPGLDRVGVTRKCNTVSRRRGLDDIPEDTSRDESGTDSEYEDASNVGLDYIPQSKEAPPGTLDCLPSAVNMTLTVTESRQKTSTGTEDPEGATSGVSRDGVPTAAAERDAKGSAVGVGSDLLLRGSQDRQCRDGSKIGGDRSQKTQRSGNTVATSPQPARVEMDPTRLQYMEADVMERLKRVFRDGGLSQAQKEERERKIIAVFIKECKELAEPVKDAEHRGLSLRARAYANALAEFHQEARPALAQDGARPRDQSSTSTGVCVGDEPTATAHQFQPMSTPAVIGRPPACPNWPVEAGLPTASPEVPRPAMPRWTGDGRRPEDLRHPGGRTENKGGGSSSLGALNNPNGVDVRGESVGQTQRNLATEGGALVAHEARGLATGDPGHTCPNIAHEGSFGDEGLGPQPPLLTDAEMGGYWARMADYYRASCETLQVECERLKRREDRTDNLAEARQDERIARYESELRSLRQELERSRQACQDRVRESEAPPGRNSRVDRQDPPGQPPRRYPENTSGNAAVSSRYEQYPEANQLPGNPNLGEDHPSLAFGDLASITPNGAQRYGSRSNLLGDISAAPKKECPPHQDVRQTVTPPAFDAEGLERAGATNAQANPSASRSDTRPIRSTPKPPSRRGTADEEPDDSDHDGSGDPSESGSHGRRDGWDRGPGRNRQDPGGGGDYPPPGDGRPPRRQPPDAPGGDGGDGDPPGNGASAESEAGGGRGRPWESSRSDKVRAARLTYAEVLRNIPVFKAPTAERSWESYLSKFIQICEDNDVDERDFGRTLFLKLEGDAELTASNLEKPLRSDFPSLVNCLTKRYVKVQDREDASVELDRRFQNEGETIEQFCKSICDLARVAHPDDLEERKRAIFRRLRSGILDNVLRSRYKDYVKAHPNPSIEDVVDELKEHDPLHVPGGRFKPVANQRTLQSSAAESYGGYCAPGGPGDTANVANFSGGQQSRGGGGAGRRGRNRKGKKTGNNGGPGQPDSGYRQNNADANAVNQNGQFNSTSRPATGNQWERERAGNQPPSRSSNAANQSYRGSDQQSRDHWGGNSRYPAYRNNDKDRSGRQSDRGRGYAPSRGASSSRGGDRPPPGDHSEDICHRCGRKGHWSRECATGRPVFCCNSSVCKEEMRVAMTGDLEAEMDPGWDSGNE